MIISFIGMSGAGKSFWAKRLEKNKGYKRYSCDDLIEKELSSELVVLGRKGVNNLSHWMGQPYDERYETNSRRYLEFEAKALENSLKEIENNKSGDNVVMDTTGSVVYLPPELLQKLKQLTRVVYLETSESIIEKMINLYLADPKPVIWGNLYKPLPGEDKMETLKRCYPELLRYRVNLYGKLADIRVGYFRKEKSFTVEDLLKIIDK